MKIIVEKAVIEQALEALEKTGIEGTWLLHDEAITALREALAEQAEQEPSCNQHPDAPHGFARNASHNAGRYVCECEGWEPEQEPVLRYAHIKCPVCDVENPGIHKCAAPVRTKDLTGEEIERILTEQPNGEHMNLHWFYNAARAVIAADREKNK